MRSNMMKLAGFAFVALTVLIEAQFVIMLVSTNKDSQMQAARVEDLKGELVDARQALAASEARRLSDSLAAKTKMTSLEYRLRSNDIAIDRFEDSVDNLRHSSDKNMLLTAGAMKLTAALKDAVIPDIGAMADKMVSPSVRISTPNGVGGGVIIYSYPDKAGDYDTYIITAFHVVSKSVKRFMGRELRDKVTVTVFDGSERDFQADIVTYTEPKDLALLKVVSTDEFKKTASLVPRKNIDSIGLFRKLYAVGCPLGNSPLHSSGEITAMSKTIGGESFWMINAPTIYGNSGGGIFLADTCEVVGISSMISVYDNVVSIPVTHLGIMAPASSIYAFLDSQSFEFIYDRSLSKEECEVRRLEARKTTPDLVKVTWDF